VEVTRIGLIRSGPGIEEDSSELKVIAVLRNAFNLNIHDEIPRNVLNYPQSWSRSRA